MHDTKPAEWGPRSRELLQNIQTCKKKEREKKDKNKEKVPKKALKAVRKHTG